MGLTSRFICEVSGFETHVRERDELQAAEEAVRRLLQVAHSKWRVESASYDATTIGPRVSVETTNGSGEPTGAYLVRVARVSR